jgi:hypothetical protein
MRFFSRALCLLLSAFLLVSRLRKLTDDDASFPAGISRQCRDMEIFNPPGAAWDLRRNQIMRAHKTPKNTPRTGKSRVSPNYYDLIESPQYLRRTTIHFPKKLFCEGSMVSTMSKIVQKQHTLTI